MGDRVADTIQQAVRDPQILDALVMMFRPSAAIVPGLGLELACVLRLRASALAADGWYDDALIDVEEALRISRRTTIIRRTNADVQLAAALSVRANLLRCSSREQEAVEDARQSLDLCRARFPHAPHRFGPLLLGALDELARALDKSGEPAQALPPAEELIHTLRRLAPRRPRYEPQLAAALHQLGVYLSHTGELTGALRAANESRQLYRRLDAKQPDSFALQVDLATHNRDILLDLVNQQG
ncbi:tetratricopeptide repeat protein [Nocardia sp. NPDC056100]|uniref:tetratricopeptide repeat protein n=1 Tax=Nocardia sp. NPDC056100 TaxID=3345712 RepID=UPI0035D89940